MKVAIATNPGKVRQRNEDSCGTKGDIFIVADGMGGHQAGDVASTVAVDRILAKYNPTMSLEEVKDLIIGTNNEVFQMAENDSNYNGMGTTVSVLVLKEKQYYLLHVGDSRIYLYKNEKLHQLTTDHSVVGELMRNGGITADEAKTHPQRNILTRALGTGHDLDIEIKEGTYAENDLFMLCTDGLSGVVNVEDMEKTLTEDISLQSKADKLVQLADDKGGPDNITVILVQV